MRVTETAVKRPIATMMVFLIIITLGTTGFRYLPIDLLPPIEFPSLSISVNYPGVGPEEMEEIVTRQVENGVSGIAGIERVRSRAQEGSTWISLDFTRGTDLAEATNDVRAALDDIWLPPEASQPSI